MDDNIIDDGVSDSKLYGLLLTCVGSDCPIKQHIIPTFSIEPAGVKALAVIAKDLAVQEKTMIRIVEFTVTKVIKVINGGH